MKVFCILSDERAALSRSPAIFSAIMARVGIKGAYVPFSVAPSRVGEALNSLRILNIAGANITVPYKEAAIPYMDVLSEGANIIGAVNTVVKNGETLKGYNTNAIGIMDALSHAGFEVEGKTALVIGTGGAAKAVAFILNWLRTGGLLVAGRNPEKAKLIVDRFGGKTISLEDLAERPTPVQILVNATPVSSPDESREMAELVGRLKIPGCELVLDLNYDRKQNFWQDMAMNRGIRFMDGISPLVYQARRTFALWTGIQVPPSEFIKVLEAIP